jgi:hypothetical protein
MGGRRIRGSGPIGERAGEQGLQDEQEDHRNREGKQSAFTLFAATPHRAPRDDDQRRKQNGTEYCELGAYEFQTIAEMKGESLLAGIMRGMGEGGEAVTPRPPRNASRARASLQASIATHNTK